MTKKEPVVGWEQVPIVVDLPYVAVVLGAHPEVIRRYLVAGKLRGFKVGREWRILKTDLMAFVGEGENDVRSA